MGNEVMVANGGGIVPQGANAVTQMGQAREVAEAVGAMQVAKAFPRDVVAATDAIRNACARPSLAEKAVYTYVKGRQEVSGPSIRLAEALAQSWGNLQYGVRELDQRNGVSTCEAFCWDMQTNVKQVKVFQVSHIRHTKRGDYAVTDPREIYEMVANNGARRVRACILGVIPGDIVEDAVAACETTLKTKIDCSPERVKKMAETFRNEFGVETEQIEKRIQCRLGAIRPAQFAGLVKVYTSLKDGMSKPEDWFEPLPKMEGDAKDAQEGSKKAPRTLRDAIGVNAPAEAAKPAEGAESAHDPLF